MNDNIEDRVLEIIEEALIDSPEFGKVSRRSDRIYFRDVDSSAWYEVIVRQEESDIEDSDEEEEEEDDNNEGEID